LYRYDTVEYVDEIIGEATAEALANQTDADQDDQEETGVVPRVHVVGLYKLNPVLTLSLKPPGFKTLNLSSENLVSKFAAFKFNLCRYGVFRGHAKWSRSQLMNEIARGDWGLCVATPRDLTAGWRHTGDALWRSLYDSGRAVFAKVEDE
jgi:hypothetical protein